MALEDNTEPRLHAYREFFRYTIDAETIHEIRDSLNQELVLGREDFKDKIAQTLKRQTPNIRFREEIENLTGRRVTPKKRGPKPKRKEGEEFLL